MSSNPSFKNAHTQLDALVTDAHTGSLNHPVNLLLVFPAEGAAKGSLGLIVHGITSVLSFRYRNISA